MMRNKFPSFFIKMFKFVMIWKYYCILVTDHFHSWAKGKIPKILIQVLMFQNFFFALKSSVNIDKNKKQWLLISRNLLKFRYSCTTIWKPYFLLFSFNAVKKKNQIRKGDLNMQARKPAYKDFHLTLLYLQICVLMV